jgi:two-component system NtrC family sensor kinase
VKSEGEQQKVLIVDERRENIVFLANNILKPKGYDIITAMDGKKGLRKALEEKPDLIIMDLKVPEMNGLEVLTALRQEQCPIPVILTTYHDSANIIIEDFRLGIKDYVLKPYTVEEMEGAIQRTLSNDHTGEEIQRSPELAEGLREGIREINQRLERRVRELSTLHDVGRAVTSLLELEKVLNRVVEAAVFLTGAEEGFLLLVDKETEELYMRAAQGLSQKEARSFRIKVEDSLSGQVVTTGKPIMISSVRNQETFALKTGYLVKALLHVPLRLGDEVIGVLSVHNKISPKPFSDSDLRTLTILVGYAAVAIENARLYTSMEERVRQLSQRFVRGVGTYEQQLQKSKEVEQLAQELRALVAAAENLTEQLKIREKEAENLAERWRTPSN